jgi:type IX secretion system PorP/SprF family membrane protein
MQYKNIVLFTLLFCTSSQIFAQDAHFSQYYMSPLQLNPALTGQSDCNNRIIVGYRNQWADLLGAQSYTTYSASYDQMIPIGRYNGLGLGISLAADQAGELNFSDKQAKITASYSERLGGNRTQSHYLSVGGEVGVIQRSIDLSKAQFATSYNGNGGFDGNTGVPQDINTNATIADIGAGLLWTSTLSDAQKFHIGAAAAHVSRGNQALRKADNYNLAPKFSLHFGGEFMLNDRVGLVPNVAYFTQGKSFEFLPSSAVKFNFSDNKKERKSFQVGLGGRFTNNYNSGFVGDAAIVNTRFDYQNFVLGLSYDINVSKLSATTGQGSGGLELNLQYKFCKTGGNKTGCPTF